MDRRDFLAKSGIFGLSGLLAACAGPETPGDPPKSPRSGHYPVVLRHQLGTTTVPAPPRRVVALGAADADAALALDAPLVAVGIPPILGHVSPWTAPHLGSARTLDQSDGPPLERIAAMRPDLILCAGMEQLDEAVYDELSSIAPTTAYQTGRYRDGWAQITEQVGRALDQHQRAQGIVADLRSRVHELRGQHPQWSGRTFSIANVTDAGTVGVLRATSDSGVRLMHELGWRLAPAVARLPGRSYAAQISEERLDVLDADVLIAHHTSRAARAELESNPAFARLPAVRRGSYIALPQDPFIAVRMPSPLSLPYGLDRLVPALERASPA